MSRVAFGMALQMHIRAAMQPDYWHYRGNWRTGSGVYCHMRIGALALLGLLTASAQEMQLSPIDAAVSEVWTARQEGRFADAVARREEARKLLSDAPVGSPQFAHWVQNVYSLYQNSGMYARAREVAEQALGRASSLDEGSATRIQLLTLLAQSWRDDRSLLKAVSLLEKAAKAQEAAPPAGAAPYVNMDASGLIAVTGNGRFQSGPRLGSFRPGSGLAGSYQQLADLYQQLGRPDAVAATMARLKGLKEAPDYSLVAYYEREGKFDEAAAVYQQEVSQAAGDPQQKAAALQQLAGLYQRQQRFDDAAATLQQAIAAAQAASSPGDIINLSQELARVYRQAGQSVKADKLYQQLLADNQGGADQNYYQVVINYANYLNASERGDQAENLLKDYQASHSQMQPGQEINLLYSLASAARTAGSPERAAEYLRAAEQKNRPAGPPADVGDLQQLLTKAQAAANAGKTDDAFSLSLQAMAAAAASPQREQISWSVISIASRLAQRNAAAQAEQLYQQAFSLAEAWSADSLQPLAVIAANYPAFLTSQKDRVHEAPQAIDRYRAVLVRARGANTGFLTDAQRMMVDYERSHGSPKRAILLAQDLVAMLEGTSGPTGRPVMDALQLLEGIYETSGDLPHALPVQRRVIAMADLVFAPAESQRATTRMKAALLLARLGEFDEADRTAAEAVSLAGDLRPAQPALLTRDLEQLQRLKNAPPKDAPVARDVVVRRPIE